MLTNHWRPNKPSVELFFKIADHCTQMEMVALGISGVHGKLLHCAAQILLTTLGDSDKPPPPPKENSWENIIWPWNWISCVQYREYAVQKFPQKTCTLFIYYWNKVTVHHLKLCYFLMKKDNTMICGVLLNHCRCQACINANVGHTRYWVCELTFDTTSLQGRVTKPSVQAYRFRDYPVNS